MASFNLSHEINLALEQYCDEAQRALDEAAEEAAELTANQLKSSSPKRTSGKGKGAYAKGWKVKKQQAGHLVSFIVYNSRSPGLTHVLEHGHESRNQYGSYGRVRAIPHIGKAAEAGIQRFELGARTRLRSIK